MYALRSSELKLNKTKLNKHMIIFDGISFSTHDLKQFIVCFICLDIMASVNFIALQLLVYGTWTPFQYKVCLSPGMGISFIMKIKWPWDRLIFNMGIPTLVSPYWDGHLGPSGYRIPINNTWRPWVFSFYHTRPCAYQWFQGCACKVCETHRLKVKWQKRTG